LSATSRTTTLFVTEYVRYIMILSKSKP
jgi:hypothetical protein